MFKSVVLLGVVGGCFAAHSCIDGHCETESDVVLEKHGDVTLDKEVQVMIQAKRVEKGKDGKVRRHTSDTTTRVEFFDFVDGTYVDYPFPAPGAIVAPSPSVPATGVPIVPIITLPPTTTTTTFGLSNPRVPATCEFDNVLKFVSSDADALTNNEPLPADKVIISYPRVFLEPNPIDLHITARAGYQCGRCSRNGMTSGFGRINVERNFAANFTATFSEPVPHDFQFVILDFDHGNDSPTMREQAGFAVSQVFGEYHGDLVEESKDGGYVTYTSMTPAGGGNNPTSSTQLNADQMARSVSIFLPAGTTSFDFNLGIPEPEIPNNRIGRGRNFFLSGATNAVCDN